MWLSVTITGIGGLTVANALIKKGLSVEVVERAASFSATAGAGFGFSPNGHICLGTLGFAEQCQDSESISPHTI